jgi:hypothetical protein
MTFKRTFLAQLSTIMILISCDGQKDRSESQIPGKKDTIMNQGVSDTTGQLMKEDNFWKLIDQARVVAKNDYQKQIVALKTILQKLDAYNIQKFDNTFTSLLAISYDWKLWGASFVINGGCSDDCFDYFRQYLIGHGKDKFYQTLKDPESCVSWMKSEEEDNWEGLQYSAMDAYKQKTGKEIPKTYSVKFELKGVPFDEEKVFKQYPRLAKKFMRSE